MIFTKPTHTLHGFYKNHKVHLGVLLTVHIIKPLVKGHYWIWAAPGRGPYSSKTQKTKVQMIHSLHKADALIPVNHRELQLHFNSKCSSSKTKTNIDHQRNNWKKWLAEWHTQIISNKYLSTEYILFCYFPWGLYFPTFSLSLSMNLQFWTTIVDKMQTRMGEN